ncbi:hypothetical protein, partial [Acidovorax sp. SUPP2522]|uniref:hypothetical protein n=1 Tax=Acidovorax sp. SUPP2522 TaxID=511900 RepID=UPI0024E126D6
LVLARGLSEQVELQGATGSDHGKGWSTHSRSTRDRMGFERFPVGVSGVVLGSFANHLSNHILWLDTTGFSGIQLEVV